MTEAEGSSGPRKKHRHDLGQEDHGPRFAVGTTRAIQALLGTWVALTVALVVYTLIEVSGPHTTTPPPAPVPTVPR